MRYKLVILNQECLRMICDFKVHQNGTYSINYYTCLQVFFQLRCNHVIQRSLLFFMYINKSNFLEFVSLCLYYSPNQVQHDSIQMIWLYKKAIIPLYKNKLVLIFLDFPKDPCNNGGYNRCDEVIGVKIYQLWFNIYLYVAR